MHQKKKKKIKLDYLGEKKLHLPKWTLEMQEQWSRVLILSSRKFIVYKLNVSKTEGKTKQEKRKKKP